MMRRIGLILGGLFLSAILANVYYVGFCVVFIFVFGIENETFAKIGFWVCFAAAVATIAYWFRNTWSPAKPKGDAVTASEKNH